MLLPLSMAIASTGRADELNRVVYAAHRRLKKARGYSPTKKSPRKSAHPTTPSESKDSELQIFPPSRAVEVLIVAGGVRGDVAAAEELFWGGRKVRTRSPDVMCRVSPLLGVPVWLFLLLRMDLYQCCGRSCPIGRAAMLWLVDTYSP